MLKAYQIGMFLFILNLSVMMLAEMPLFGSAYMDSGFTTNMSGNWSYTYDPANNQYYLAYDSGLVSTVNATDYMMTNLDEASILDALVLFGRALYNATVFLPWYLENLGLPFAISIIISAPVWFSYIACVVQIIRGVIIED